MTSLDSIRLSANPDKFSPDARNPRSALLKSRPRVVFYSHDTMGLGHKRRNHLLAKALAKSDVGANILMIMGVYEQGHSPLPARVDYLTLPALYKSGNRQYCSRSLDVSLADLIQIRSNTILATLKAFKPDVFIVDTVPRGAERELDSTLKYLREHTQTQCVLGLRDILDTPATTQREWAKVHNLEVIRHYYNAIWVYGDPRIYDVIKEYNLPEDIAARLRYVGYLDQQARLLGRADSPSPTNYDLPPGSFVLCCVGGGQDGAQLVKTFAESSLPPNLHGVILTGPFMSPSMIEELHQVATHHPRLSVLTFVDESTELVKRAERVICMGGYNTTCEILSFAKSALIVPRVHPRQEQWIRAERLRQLGLVDVLHPDDLTPSALSHWMGTPTTAPTSSWVRENLDLNGLTLLPDLLQEMLESADVLAPSNSSSSFIA